MSEPTNSFPTGEVPTGESPWRGRTGEAPNGQPLRWHQAVSPFTKDAPAGGIALIGLASDEGVRRNGGRIGASDGPVAIRRALANLSYDLSRPLYDAGDIPCQGDELEDAQARYASAVTELLGSGQRVVALGGGHEIAWGSFQGIMGHLGQAGESPPRVGIINFDAHFDLRDPVTGGNSGTPFRQIAEKCDAVGQLFRYMVLGLSRSSNTRDLFDYARARGVDSIEDALVHMGNLDWLQRRVRAFIKPVDFLYVTICLDVFSPGIAPGVSAPAGLGISAEVAIHLLRSTRAMSEDLNTPIILTDIAEMNPRHDLDDRTARLAARLVWEVCQE